MTKITFLPSKLDYWHPNLFLDPSKLRKFKIQVPIKLDNDRNASHRVNELSVKD